MQHDYIAQLDDVLDRERAALLYAQYDKLAPLLAIKQQLLTELAGILPARSELARLKVRMQSNLDLTSAALRGIKAANDRIRDLKAVRNGLTTYDQSGQVARVPTPMHKVEKKA